MENFFDWHILIVLASFAVPLTLLGTVASDARMARRPFAVRYLGLMGVIIVSTLVVTSLPEKIAEGVVVLLLPILLVSLWSVRWSAARFQDMGLSKWLTLLYVIPVVGALVLLWQCLAGSSNLGRPAYR